MTISVELQAEILRCYHVEKWRIGTISRLLKVHHNVVRRVLAETGVPKTQINKSPLLEPFLPLVLEILNKYPGITARRVYDMVCERGYRGNADHFRHLVAMYRPKPIAEAYLRLHTLPGEQGQVDWAHFGHITIGRARRPLMAFVMVLSYSRKIFLRFYLNAKIENFLRGHTAAFQAFGGVPKVLLCDNLKSAVLERIGNAIRFNPVYLSFASHYRYEPRPVAIARGNEKGRTERAIRYCRESFFTARVWKDLDDLNNQALTWCNGIAANRLCPEDRTKTVAAAFLEEQPLLLRSPDNPYPTTERVEVRVGKTPYVRFDLNDYSIPYQYVRRTLTVLATIEQVTILAGTEVIASHARSYDKGKQIEIAEHIQKLEARKHQASQHRGQNRLIHAIPIAITLLQQAASRGFHMGQVTAQLLRLLDSYGVTEMSAALQIAIANNTPHPNSVRFILEQRRQELNKQPLIELDLPADKRIREITIIPHSLTTYVNLTTEEETNEK